ncbi:MAG TPA: DUF2059 domain-containing protein [Bauldia sp.]|nr:DUF2059 domain-containing protein [Bauldia sp.]
MIAFRKLALASLLGVALMAVPAVSHAQEISPSQLAAALDAVHATRALRDFDQILPKLAIQAENRLIAQRPDLSKQIMTAVEAAATKLVSRRVDLDNDAARIWAKAFTEDELKAIAAFFKTPAGQKYANVEGQLYTDTLNVVGQWQDRLGDELLQQSHAELKAAGVDF